MGLQRAVQTATRRGNSIPAVVVDSLGGSKVTVRLSTSGAVLKRIPSIGAVPVAGDSGYVDYSSGSPIFQVMVLSTGETEGVAEQRPLPPFTGLSMVILRSKLSHTSWDGDNKTSANNGILDLSALFGVPARIKAVYVRLEGTPPNIGDYVSLGSDSGNADCLYVYGNTAGQVITVTGWVPCNENGDVYIYFSANITNVKLFIWGYAF